MKNLTHSLCILTGALALAAGACSSSTNPGSTGTGGTKGQGGSGATTSDGSLPLTPTDTGFVSDVTTGVIGAWYAYGDSVGSKANLSGPDAVDSDCQKKGGFPPTACSQISAPVPGQPFATDPTTGALCTTGVAAQVMMGSNGMPDYSDLWGAGIALDFNNPGGDAGAKGVWDGSKYTGVEFDIMPGTGTGGIPSTTRVNFPFTGEHGTDSPYYKGATNGNSGLPAKGGHVIVKWTDVGGPAYLTTQNPPVDITKYPFNTTMIQSIQFQVFTNVSTTTPYSFCVSNLAVTTK